jgi:4-hydroxythreonine-4-phosphate dehydrogenase
MIGMTGRPAIGVTLGDPVGIGPEIVARAVLRSEVLAVARPLVIGTAAIVERTADALGLKAVVETTGDPAPDRIVIAPMTVRRLALG